MVKPLFSTPFQPWFEEMFELSKQNKGWSKAEYLNILDALRDKYNDHSSLLEMSWEVRDSIWYKPLVKQDIYKSLAQRYHKAYLISCKERGVLSEKFDINVNNLEGVKRLRNIYLESRKAEYVILTPKETNQPKINTPLVYGVRPGSEIIYRVAAVGKKPIKYKIKGLPRGCSFDSEQGVIRGAIAKEGRYDFSVIAQNKYGNTEKALTIIVGATISLTPPMGWNSWNAFGIDVTARDIKNTADQLVKSGLADYGWNYVNIDDCWMLKPDTLNLTRIPKGQENAVKKFYNIKKKKIRNNQKEITGSPRDSHGNILSNKDFPDMKSLTDYIHHYGLRAGLYTSPGPYTCQIYEGSYGHELADAKQYAEWGFDYLKHDWCGYRAIVEKPNLEEAKYPFQLMGDALKQLNRDILYSLCQYGRQDVWKWGDSVGGNLWRTTGDIHDTWDVVSRIGFRQAGLEAYAKPGNWNDPDMLVVGYVGWSKNLRPTYLSPNEQYTHISLWSLLAAPLLIGCDLTRLDDFTYGLLSNSEVIAINQDILGKQASRVIKEENIEVWSKPLADGSIAVGIFNLGEDPVDYSLSLSSLNLSGEYQVRDLWKQENMGEINSRMSFKVNRHGVKLIKIYRDIKK